MPISGNIYRQVDPVESGGGRLPSKKEPAKVTPPPKKIDPKSLDSLVQKSDLAIFEAKTNRFLDFFPDYLSIYVNRITIHYRGMLYKDEFPLLIESVTGARVAQGFRNSTLTISTFGFKDAPPPIRYLKNEDARIARRYVLALIECKKANVDLSDYSIDELKDKLRYVGKVRESV